MKKPKILVVGSFVMDLIVSTGKFPGSGETVLGETFTTAPGGKGANQAVQAARMGAAVAMVGKVGDDGFGKELVASVEGAGIDTSGISICPDKASAIGNIILEVVEGQKSRNRIIVVPGANMAITLEDIAFLEHEIASYDMVLLQLEIPMEINEYVADIAHRNGVKVMLNSAPSAPLSDKLLSCLTYISPNEHEAADMTGVEIRKSGKEVNMEDVKKAVDILLGKGVENVIITLGSSGAAVANRHSLICKPCVDIVAVADPTAAGDSFVGAFCTAVCAGFGHSQALDISNYTATLTVSRIGAQPSLPTITEVAALMKKDGYKGFDLSLLQTLL